MTEKQRDEILLKLLERTSCIGDIKAKLEEHDRHFKEIDKHFHEIDERFKKVDEHFKETDSKLDENIKLTRDINRSVAKIEVEHGSKLSALFDAFTVYSEKIDALQNDIKNIYSILDRHDDEIFLFKTK